MRKQIFTLTALLLSVSLFAQIREERQGMSQGPQNALVITLPNTSEKVVEDVWKDFMKEYKAKPKYDRKQREHFSDDAEISLLRTSNPTVDVYANIEERGDDVDFALWIDMGGAFLSSKEHPDQYRDGEKFLMSFALEVARAEVDIELDEQEKELKKLESTLKKLQNDHEHYEKEIKNAKERIAKAEKDIEDNLKEQGNVNKMIEQQLNVIEEVKKKLKDLK